MTPLSEKFLWISAIVIVNLFSTQAATISRPFDNDLYPISPTEVLQMKPLQIYPQARNLKYFKTSEDAKDNDKVVYVKLVKVNYRPKHLKTFDEFAAPKDFAPKDIFYVKALANGQFSDQRLKFYRIPEFYAINVYKKNKLL